MKKKMQAYIGYEYKEIKVKSNNISKYIDSYNNFGWEFDSSSSIISENDNSVIRLKRNLKIMNKAELTRLERNFEDCMKKIEFLEKSKKASGLMLSINVGLCGIGFILGGIFIAFNKQLLSEFYILLFILGFIGLGLPYFLYKYISNKRENIVTPLIEEKYIEIYEICKKGNKLLKINNSQTFL